MSASSRHPRARPEDLSTRQGIQKSDKVSGPADPRVEPEDDVRGKAFRPRGPYPDANGAPPLEPVSNVHAKLAGITT